MRISLRGVTKVYGEKDETTLALDGVSLDLPENGLVCILGPSGCGKTTLLNILGGLDSSTEGSIEIDGKDLESLDSKGIDEYRNRKVGFVFQDYDLLSNLTCFENVRTALDIRGIPRDERDRCAQSAMEAVGVWELKSKRPNQISGGQKQRVCIARAIVGDPGVILADEPTGALDSHMGQEVISILAGEAKKRLVVVVTHNAELADQFADLIVHMKDGKVESIAENKPIGEAKDIPDVEAAPQGKRIGLGFVGAVEKGVKHIRSSLGRFLTLAISTSFGIMFLAFTLCIVNGFGGYVERVDRQTGSQMSYIAPAYTVRSVSDPWSDYNQTQEYPDGDLIYPYYTPQSTQEYTYNSLDSHYFQFLEQLKVDGLLSDYVINYSGDGGMRVLTEQPGRIEDSSGAGAVQVDTEKYAGMAPGTGGMNFEPTSIFHPLFGDYSSDYDILAGRFPEEEDEAVLIVDKRNAVDFSTLRALGFYNSDDSQEEIYDPELDSKVVGFSFDKALGKEYRIYSLDSFYSPKGSRIVVDGDGNPREISVFSDAYLDFAGTTDSEKLNSFYASVEPDITLKVVGIIRPDRSIASPSMRTGIGYLQSLSDTVEEMNSESEVAKSFQSAIYLNPEVTSSEFISELTEASEPEGGEESETLDVSRIQAVLESCLMGAAPVNSGYASSSDSLWRYTTFRSFFTAAGEYCADLVDESLKGISLSSIGQIEPYLEQLIDLYLSGNVEGAYSLLTSICGLLYSYSTISSITLIPTSLETSNRLAAALRDYNDIVPGSVYHAQSEGETVYVQDYISYLTSDVGQAIGMASTILIIFAVISMVAAAVICATVTNMSVIERVKEIGILRSLGASRSDIGFMFEAESLLAGLIGGLLGCLLAFIFTFPANAIINAFYPQYDMNNICQMAWWHPLAVVPPAVVIALIAALVPSLKASKRDPVKCLRSE